MSKENYVVPLDNLLRRYQRDRQWLSILCQTPYREFLNLLESKKTTYGNLQDLLAKGGISLRITVQGEEPPIPAAPRMQFLKSNFMRHRNRDEHIETVTGIAGAPKKWFNADDIPLSDLCKVERAFRISFLFNFYGISDQPSADVMKSVTYKNNVDWKALGENCLLRFKQNCRNLFGDSVPVELRTQAVLKDAPQECLKRIQLNVSTTAVITEPGEPKASPETELFPSVPEQKTETRKDKKPEAKQDDKPDNEQLIRAMMKETGLGRKISGALVFDKLDAGSLSDKDLLDFTEWDAKIKETIDYFRKNYSWILRLLEKKGMKEQDLFIAFKHNWYNTYTAIQKQQAKDKTPVTLYMRKLQEILREGGYGFVLRFKSKPILDTKHRVYMTGAIRDWFENNTATLITLPGYTRDEIYNKDDISLSDKTIQELADLTGETVFFHLFKKGTNKSRPKNELVFIEPQKPVNSAESAKTAEKTEAAQPVTPPPAEPKPSPANDKPKPAPEPVRENTVKQAPATKPDVPTWIRSQKEYPALVEKLGKPEPRLLDGRYGDDTVNAVLRFDAEENLVFALLSRRLMQAVRSGLVDERPGAEPDFDGQMLIADNRRFINRLQCIDEILSTLRRSFGNKVISFPEPIKTIKGPSAVSLSLNIDDGLNIQTEDKGFLKKKVGTFTANDPYQLADLFTTEQWQAIVNEVNRKTRAETETRLNAVTEECRGFQKEAAKALEKTRTALCTATVHIVSLAGNTGLLEDFAIISGSALYDSPSLRDGHVWFHKTKDEKSETVNEEQIHTDTLAAINETFIKMLEGKTE